MNSFGFVIRQLAQTIFVTEVLANILGLVGNLEKVEHQNPAV